MKGCIVLALNVLVVLTSFAQSKSFTTEVSSKVIGTKDTLRVTYTSNRTGSFEAPTFFDFKVVSGPKKSTSSSLSIINGEETSSQEIKMVYLLTPKKKGFRQVPGATLLLDKGKMESNTVSIEVERGHVVDLPKIKKFSFFDELDELDADRLKKDLKNWGEANESDINLTLYTPDTTVYYGDTFFVDYIMNFDTGQQINVEYINYHTIPGVESWDDFSAGVGQVLPGSNHVLLKRRKFVAFKKEEIYIKPFEIKIKKGLSSHTPKSNELLIKVLPRENKH